MNVTISLKTNYTRIVWYVSIINGSNGSGKSYGHVYRIYYSDDNTYKVGVRNLASSQIKVHSIVRCVYVKNTAVQDLGDN